MPAICGDLEKGIYVLKYGMLKDLFDCPESIRSGIWFYPTYNLVSQSITVSWMLAEDMKLLDQRQRDILVIAP